MKKIFLILTLALVALAGCKKDPGPIAVKVSQIKLVGMPTTAFNVGRSVTISAVITPDDATDKSVTFTSSNPEVATVEYTKSENNYSLALLKAVGPGKATITATANDGSGVKAEAEVDVLLEGHIAVTGVSLDTEGVEIYTGSTKTVKALIEPADATNKNVTWTIGNPEIATVNDGVVTGVAEGETTLTVTTVDGGFTASIPVKVVYSPVESLLGKWSGKVYYDVTIRQGNDANSIFLDDFPSSDAVNGVKGYVMSDNTIRIPKQKYEMPYYPTGSDEPDYYYVDFIPLNGDELVISYDSDHIYISDAFEIRKKDIYTGKYGTYRGEADTLIRVQ